MDSRLDIERQKLAEYREALRSAMQDWCKECDEHNENCPYYDAEQESWDYELCYKERG